MKADEATNPAFVGFAGSGRIAAYFQLFPEDIQQLRGLGGCSEILGHVPSIPNAGHSPFRSF